MTMKQLNLDALEDEMKKLEGAQEEETSNEEPVEESQEVPEEQKNTEGEASEQAEAPQEPPRNSRAQERIRKLANERNQIRQELEQSRKEALEWKKKALDTRKRTLSGEQEMIKSHIKTLKNSLEKAHQESNTKDIVELTAELQNAQVKLMAIDSYEAEELTQSESEVLQGKAQAVPNAPDLSGQPEALQDWVEDNTWFTAPKTQRDVKRAQTAVLTYDLLVEEGLDPESKDFYEELNSRIGLAQKDSDGVYSKKSKTSSPPDKALKRRQQQTVQGASRTPPPNPKNQKTTLTDNQKKIASIFGLTEKQYEQELLKSERSAQQGSRMTTLFDR